MGQAQPTPAAPQQARSPRWRRLHAVWRLALACSGLAAALTLLGLFWPPVDRSQQPQQLRTPADLAKPPNRPITVLVVGLDSDSIAAAPTSTPARNAPARHTAARDAPVRDAAVAATARAPANADALLLVRVDPQAPLQVLSVPPSLAVQLPGQRRPQALGSLYRLGGVALLAGALSDYLALERGQPERYLVLSRGGLRALVDGLGSVEVHPSRAMRYEDRSQKLTIDLQAGLQRLSGLQSEHLLRYRDPQRPAASRQENQIDLLRGLVLELSQPQQLGRLPELVKTLQPQVLTNLSTGEILSLLAVGLSRSQQARFQGLPLAPEAPGHGGLHQLAADTPTPPWPTSPSLNAPAAAAGAR